MSSKKVLKYTITASLATAVLFMTGCSSKKPGKQDINKVYQYNPSTKIRNSKAMHRATLRPYEVFGKKYYPQIVGVGQKQKGIASWYGPNFHSKKTSNGEIYNMYAMTAAHKTLPMNTMLRVLNLENGKSTIVRVNDRGPFVDGRIIDLSNSAAHAIDMVRKGTVKVEIQVLGYNGIIDNHNAPIKQAPVIVKKKPVVKKVAKIETIKPMQIKEVVVPSKETYALQVGAFGRLEGAQATQQKYKAYTNNVVIRKVFSNSRYLYKVFIKGFPSLNDANAFKDVNGLTNAIPVGKIK